MWSMLDHRYVFCQFIPSKISPKVGHCFVLNAVKGCATHGANLSDDEQRKNDFKCQGVRSFELSLQLTSCDLFLWFTNVARRVDFVR